MRTQRLIQAIATLVVLTCATHAQADPVKCSRAIAKEYGKYVAAASKVIDKCKNGVIAKHAPASLAGCPDAAGAAKINAAAASMKAKIAGQCGGADKTCDGAGDDSLASIHWNTGQCMGFEAQCGAIAIGNCGDVGDCLVCIGDAAIEQGVDGLLYDRLNPASFAPNNGSEPNKTRNTCQIAVTKNAVKFLQAKVKILNKCWDAKLNNKAGFADAQPCPDTDPSIPNKTVAAIQSAEQKKIAAICKACGAGGDGDKNGLCDSPPGLVLGDIVQTPFTCPNVMVPPNAVHPGGLDCGAIVVTDLQSYADCIDCVLEFKADCVTHAGVGDNSAAAGIDYPTQCNPPVPTATPTPTSTPNGTATATPTGPTATSTPQATCTPKPNCGNGIVDVGEQCDPNTASNCPGSVQCAPADTCDGCTCPTGDFTFSATANADLDTGWTGISHDNAALVGKLFDAKTYGCSSAGPDKQCTFVAQYGVPFFGPPLPLSSGATPVCVVNELPPGGAADGTLDLVTGELHYNYDLISHVYVGLSIGHPCPTCDNDPGFDDGMLDGTCNGGEQNGSPCDADATSQQFGKTSFNCFPPTAAAIGDLKISFVDAQTGSKSISTSASSPSCTANGVTGQKCFCDTCNDAAAEVCASDADCPPGGICGGLRCVVGSTTPGLACTTEGTNTDALCGQVGAGACVPGSCPAGNCVGGPSAGASCNDGTDCGSCIAGPHPGGPCLTDDECGGTCGRPGEATRPNACNGPCTAGGGAGDAICSTGPIDQLCSVEKFRGCSMTSDCRPPAEGGTCLDCAPGNQTCVNKTRECFRSTVTKTGTATPTSGAFVGLYCIGPTLSPSVNNVAGLPGLGTLRLPYALSNIVVP